MRTPTKKQAAKLSVLLAHIAVSPRRSEWAPLVRHGWVEPLHDDDGHGRFFPPLRITPDGLRAYAAAIDAGNAERPSLRAAPSDADASDTQ